MINFSLVFVHSLLILSTMVLSCSVLASEHNQLSITPEICVINKGGKECNTLLKVQFIAVKKGSYCIKIDEIHFSRCYNNTNSISLSVDFSNEKPVTVYVYNELTQKALAQKVLEVVIFKPKTRHRRNFGWNFL